MSGNMSQILGLGTFGKIGTGIPGKQNQLLGGSSSGMIGGGERSTNRKLLRKSFGNNALGGKFNYSPLYYASQARHGTATMGAGGQGSFRAAYNAGDHMGTVNEGPDSTLPHPNQVNNVKSVSLKYTTSAGSVNTGSAAFTGNPKYVYDSSDFIRYKKLKSINNNYNDSSYGGSNNGSYSSLMGVRH
jgi:hypothetical protein